MSFDGFDILLMFCAGYWFCSTIDYINETIDRYLKDGMNEFFYLSLIKECLASIIVVSCLLEVESDRFEMGLFFFPIIFLLEYIKFKHIVPFVKKLLKKGRTEDADGV